MYIFQKVSCRLSLLYCFHIILINIMQIQILDSRVEFDVCKNFNNWTWDLFATISPKNEVNSLLLDVVASF